MKYFEVRLIIYGKGYIFKLKGKDKEDIERHLSEYYNYDKIDYIKEV